MIAPACTFPAAQQATAAIIRRHGYAGVDSVRCADLTRDGKRDLVATFASGGTAGDTGWVILTATGRRWKVLIVQPQAYKVGVRIQAGDAIELQPIYRKNDPNCCPTGGVQHRRFHWNGTRFVVTKSWVTKTP